MIIWEILESKTNATSHLNIGSLKTAIEEGWNKMSEDFILKTYKLSQRCVDTIIEKITTKLNKFTILCLSSYFVVYSFQLKLILFYNRIVYYYTRIFLILLQHPVYQNYHGYKLKILFCKKYWISLDKYHKNRKFNSE